MRQTVLVLGGTRSGKSAYAVELARDSGFDVTFVATAEIGDAEMAERVAEHRRGRPAEWITLEAPRDVGEAIRGAGARGAVVVDCLSLLVSNLLLDEPDSSASKQPKSLASEIEDEVNSIFGCVDELDLLILVSDEVGQGIVPTSELGRRYRDLLGTANQLAAHRADTVFWMTAGIPQRIKG